MKKTLLTLILAGLTCISGFAQEADSVQTQQPVTIEILTAKLDKLQHDYDYLWCEFKLRGLIADLNIASNAIQISANQLYAYSREGGYNSALYKSYSDYLDSYRINFKSSKNLANVVKNTVFLKIATCGFTDSENDALYASFESVSKGLSTVEAAINYHEVALKVYRGW